MSIGTISFRLPSNGVNINTEKKGYFRKYNECSQVINISNEFWMWNSVPRKDPRNDRIINAPSHTSLKECGQTLINWGSKKSSEYTRMLPHLLDLANSNSDNVPVKLEDIIIELNP